MASATAMRPDAGASSAASGVRSPMLMASPAKPVKSASVTAQSATGTCQGPTIWSRWLRPPTVRSPMVMRKRLDCHRGVAQHVDRGVLQLHAGQVQRLELARHRGFTSRCILGGLPSSTFMGMSTGRHRWLAAPSSADQLALFGGHAHHRKRATLAFAEARNSSSDFGAMAIT
jgi:hypothetical protein